MIACAQGELEYREKGFEPWLSVAPVHIVVATSQQAYRERYSEPDKSTGPDEWDVPYEVMDAGKALMCLYLGAQEFGLACGYLGPHAGVDLVSLLGLPAQWRYLGLVTLGYRKGRGVKTRSQERGWRPFDEVVKWVP